MVQVKSNAPDAGITPEAVRVLRYVDDQGWRHGRGPRLPDGPERRLLKRKGIIYSRPPNHIANMQVIAGHGHVWYVSERGRDLIEYLGRADPSEPAYDPYPRPPHWEP